jgi:glutathione peroxidase
MRVEVKDMAETVSGVTVKTADGKDKPLSDYTGEALLIVNVASRCGYTPQYAGLEALYRKYKDQGLRILAFPCNQFGAQEPSPIDEIVAFCSTKYDVTFDLFNKIEVNGPNRSPLYAALTKTEPAGDISWNFEKFVVAKDGTVVGRFKSKVAPDSPVLVNAIERALAA